jgi:hypothetical protein
LLVKEQQTVEVGKKGVTGGLIKWLEGEVDRSEKVGTVAADSRFVLLTWTLTVFDSISVERLDPTQWSSLVNSLAVSLDSLLDENLKSKPILKKSVQVVTRRSIRIVSDVV